MADRHSSRFGPTSMLAIFLLFLSLFFNVATASPLPADNTCKEPVAARTTKTLITQAQYEAYLKKYFPDTDKYLLYTGQSADQIVAFKAKNPGYYYYNDFYEATTLSHPWYKAFNEDTQEDDGEASSMAIAAVATKQILVFGGAEYLTKGPTSFYTTKEAPILRQRITGGELPYITHMAKGATSPTQIMATEDANKKFTYKTGYKAGDTNASGSFGVCKRASQTCDAPTVFSKTLKA